jgi:hypothetical protein
VTASRLAHASSFRACRSRPRLLPRRGRALQRHRAHRLYKLYSDIVLTASTTYLSYPDDSAGRRGRGKHRRGAGLRAEEDRQRRQQRASPELAPVASYVAGFMGFHGGDPSGSTCWCSPTTPRPCCSRSPRAGARHLAPIQTYLDRHGGPGVHFACHQNGSIVMPYPVGLEISISCPQRMLIFAAFRLPRGYTPTRPHHVTSSTKLFLLICPRNVSPFTMKLDGSHDESD